MLIVNCSLMSLFNWIVLIIFLLLILLLAGTLLSNLYFIVPSLSSPRRVGTILRQEINWKNKKTFYDLGCGTGRVLKQISRFFPGQLVGFEVAPLPYLIVKSRFFNNPRVRILARDFFKQNLAQADVVYFYLLPKITQKLGLKLEKELKKGAVVVSCDFAIKAWQPDKVVEFKYHKLYFYLR